MISSERDVYIAKTIGLEMSGPKNVVFVKRMHDANTVAVGPWIGLASGAEVTEVIYLISTFEPQSQFIEVSMGNGIQ